MSYSKVSSGNNPPDDINVIIEIPAHHAPIKYEINKDADALFVDRFMSAPMFYPANYGYINNTLADDGDAIDVLVVTPNPVSPGSVIRSRPIGILTMSDESGEDSKIIAVPHKKLTVLYDDVNELDDLPSLLIQQIEHFFENYKDLEKDKWVKIDKWLDNKQAKQEIIQSIQAYK